MFSLEDRSRTLTLKDDKNMDCNNIDDKNADLKSVSNKAIALKDYVSVDNQTYTIKYRSKHKNKCKNNNFYYFTGLPKSTIEELESYISIVKTVKDGLDEAIDRCYGLRWSNKKRTVDVYEDNDTNGKKMKYQRKQEADKYYKPFVVNLNMMNLLGVFNLPKAILYIIASYAIPINKNLLGCNTNRDERLDISIINDPKELEFVNSCVRYLSSNTSERQVISISCKNDDKPFRDLYDEIKYDLRFTGNCNYKRIRKFENSISMINDKIAYVITFNYPDDESCDEDYDSRDFIDDMDKDVHGSNGDNTNTNNGDNVNTDDGDNVNTNKKDGPITMEQFTIKYKPKTYRVKAWGDFDLKFYNIEIDGTVIKEGCIFEIYVKSDRYYHCYYYDGELLHRVKDSKLPVCAFRMLEKHGLYYFIGACHLVDSIMIPLNSRVEEFYCNKLIHDSVKVKAIYLPTCIEPPKIFHPGNRFMAESERNNRFIIINGIKYQTYSV